MFQIITETYVDGKREMDSVYTKIYKRKGAAERNARSSCYSCVTEEGRTIERTAYVRGYLDLVEREIAKEAYIKCKRIWIDGKYGHVRLRNSWEYGSHAPASELFERSVEQDAYYGYNGNFYIEDES